MNIRFIIVIGAFLPGIAVYAQTNSQGAKWKEYIYPEHEFAITLPSDPHPHESSQMPGGTAYTVSLSDGGGLSLHTMNAGDKCIAGLKAQEQQYAKRNTGAAKSELNGFKAIYFRKVTAVEYNAIEFLQQVPNGRMDYERWICGHHRLFVIVVSWDSGQQQPRELERIVNSFRLLTKK